MPRKNRFSKRKKAVKKMYVLVRNDLASTYKNVQGAHALAQFAEDHPKEFKEWGNTTLVFLGVSNLNEMRDWYYYFLKRNERPKKIIVSHFCEPDLDNQITAIACYDTGIIFKKLWLA